MSHRNDSQGLEQVQCRWKQAEGLPFSELLPAAMVQEALTVDGGRDRIFTPIVTLWTFLSQVLSPDHSCRDAVARLIAWRTSHGMRACSANTGSYCEARQRLPLQVLTTLVRQSGHQLQAACDTAWLWKGRVVKIVDGTTVTMPDTEENRLAFPRTPSQSMVSFPIARLVVIFSLACGSVLEAAVSPTTGKKTGENTQFRSLHHALAAGDIVLGDRLFDSYHDIALLQGRGVDVVFRMHQSRHSDFRRGKVLGILDHRVVRKKPDFDASRFTRDGYNSLPAQMEMRELRFQVQQEGFRPKKITLVTTLLDPVRYSKEAIAALFRERWNCEVDLNALKTTLDMEHLRCKTPEAVEKEIWAHLLVYNLMRRTMAEAARQHSLLPRCVSFKGAIQTINSFAPYLTLSHLPRTQLWEALLTAIATDPVGDRPDRYEPRKIKRRKDRYTHMTRPRNVERQRLCS